MSLIYYSSNIRLGGLDGFPLSTYMNSDLLTYLLPTPTPRDLLLDMILINCGLPKSPLVRSETGLGGRGHFRRDAVPNGPNARVFSLTRGFSGREN